MLSTTILHHAARDELGESQMSGSSFAFFAAASRRDSSSGKSFSNAFAVSHLVTLNTGVSPYDDPPGITAPSQISEWNLAE